MTIDQIRHGLILLNMFKEVNIENMLIYRCTSMQIML